MQKKLFLILILAMGFLFPSFSQEVSSSGAFTYSYPIDIPAGTNGMQPNFSLNYNSQTGNGMIGMGWSLSGLQTISRDTSYDINWNNSDHFVLNGQRLIPDGLLGLNRYRTENESFLKIEYVSSSYWVVTQKNGTQLFFGNTTDSKIEAVGKSAARVWALNKVIDIHGNYYTVEYIEDTVNGDYYPSKIIYTQNNDEQINKQKEIIFTYFPTKRLDHYPKYNPSLIDLNEKLEWITINTDGQLLRKYKLSYLSQTTSLDPSRLESIQEYGSNGVSTIPGITFDWEDSPESSFINTNAYHILPGYNGKADLHSIDFDGNGITDMLSLSQSVVDQTPNFYLYSHQDLFLNQNRDFIEHENYALFIDQDGDGIKDIIIPYGYNLQTYHGTGTGYQHSQTLSTGLGNNENPVPLDFNNDGNMDLLTEYSDGYIKYINVYKSDGILGYIIKERFQVPTDQNGNSYTLIDKIPMDINGDGNMDFILYHFDGTAHLYIYNDVQSCFDYIGDFNFPILPDAAGYRDYPFSIVNLNNDDKSDLIYENSDGSIRVYKSNGLGFDLIQTIYAEPNGRYSLIPQDLNCDGLTDFTLIGFIKPESYYHSNGNEYVLANSTNYDYLDLSNSFSSVDVNGDGNKELVTGISQSGSLSDFIHTLSNGSKLVNVERIGFPYNFRTAITNPFINMNQNVYYSDFNGDGQHDALLIGYNYYILYLATKDNSRLLQSISLPMGAVITPTYTPAPQVPGAVNPSDSQYPNMANTSPRHLVTLLQVSDGMDNSYTTGYTYYNGKIHRGLRHEQKSLGFEWMIKTNPDGSFTKTYYYQKEALLYAGVTKRIESYGSDRLLYSAVENIYNADQLKAASGGYHAVNSIQKTDTYSYNFNGEDYTEWERLKNTTGIPVKHLSYNYDSNGNITNVLNEEYINNPPNTIKDINNAQLSVTTYITNADDTIFVPAEVKNYSFGMDETIFDMDYLETADNLDSSKKYFYDGDTLGDSIGSYGVLTKKISYSGEVDQLIYPDVTNEYTYDVYGNVKTVTDGNGNTTTINYETDYHTLIQSKINALGQTSEYIHYDTLLRPEYTYDIYNNYTWFAYDIYGRKTGMYDGDSSGMGTALSKTTYSDTAASPGTPILLKKETYLPEDQNNYLESYSYFNGLGQLLQEKTEGLDENGYPIWITTDYHYDPILKTSSVSKPYYSSLPGFNESVWNAVKEETIQYLDAVGRTRRIEYPDGISEYYHYGFNSIITLSYNTVNTNESLISYVEIDGLNQISYTYEKGNYFPATFSNFDKNDWVYRVTTTTAGDGVRVHEISKDDYNLSKSGNSLTTMVDNLGRKKTYDDPDMDLWSYEYDFNNNLVKQIDAEAQTITFEYDELNRTKIKHGADTVYYNYDGLTNDRSISDGKDHGSSVNGKLTGIYFGSGSYSEDYYYDDVNRIYKITKTISGKSHTYSATLDELGRITNETYPGAVSENLTYNYNTSGNIESVSSNSGVNYISGFDYNILGKILNFDQGNGTETTNTYNNKDRLIGIDVLSGSANIADMDFTYDNRGNITYKSFTDSFNGSYTENYTYDGLFRLVTADSFGLYGYKTYSYDSYNNMITNDGRSYLYNTLNPQDGGPHAVQKIEDQWGNVQKSYKYDKNGNATEIAGQSHLIIRAKGTGIIDTPPKMELWINGVETEAIWNVNSEEYQIYFWHGYIPPGALIDIVYTNDNSAGGIDSNLIVDYININGVSVHSESAEVTIDRGSYPLGCFDGSDSIAGQEIMELTGALRFPLPAGASTPVRLIKYDSENRMSSIYDNGSLTSSYGYNDVGQRIWKTENGIKTYYFFENYEQEYDTASGGLIQEVKYYFANGQRVAMRTTDDQLQEELLYFHADHLNSAVRMTDDEGNIILSIAYTPFGKVAWFAGIDVTDYTYTDQEIDDSGFMYYNARYYDPELGRFLQADTYLDGMNRYTYVGNNPIRYNDPTGHILADYHFGDEDWQKTKTIEGDDGREVEVITTNNPSNFSETNQVTIVSDNGETVSVTVNHYDTNNYDQQNVTAVEGLYNRDDYGAGITIMDRNGIVEHFTHGNTFPTSIGNEETLDAGRYEFLTDLHNYSNATEEIEIITTAQFNKYRFNNGDYMYKALRLRKVGTNQENQMPGSYPWRRSTTEYINLHAGNNGGSGVFRRASEGCNTLVPPQYISFISNFSMRERGFYDIIRF